MLSAYSQAGTLISVNYDNRQKSAVVNIDNRIEIIKVTKNFANILRSHVGKVVQLCIGTDSFTFKILSDDTKIQIAKPEVFAEKMKRESNFQVMIIDDLGVFSDESHSGEFFP